MAKAGEPTVVNARPAAQTWDGNRLPGPWLTLRALDAAMAMATTLRHRHRRHPPLAPHRVPRRVSEARDRPRHDGAHLLLGSVDVRASRRSAACRRCSRPIRSPRAFRRRGDPILLDISASYTTNGLTGAPAQGRREAAASVGAGRAGQRDRRSRACCSTSRRARCCRWAGSRRGHKGYALALLVEALTGGLAGFGRADPARRLGRDGVRAGARSRGVRRRRRVRAADGLARSTRATTRRRARASNACACPARTA